LVRVRVRVRVGVRVRVMWLRRAWCTQAQLSEAWRQWRSMAASNGDSSSRSSSS
jgi:hypothetical protein